ncbi:unnamed protein product [Meganyctiphanes norvegica]|uniref:C-type lectin domain-containing protein n=1 Tax=Meganyctiphanes norvegica TaxID=48144 RepID=A0AAV2SBA0_MEGNR
MEKEFFGSMHTKNRTKVVWQHEALENSSGSPFDLQENHNDIINSSYCVSMTVHHGDSKINPGEPYYTSNCTQIGYPLCERLFNKTNQDTKSLRDNLLALETNITKALEIIEEKGLEYNENVLNFILKNHEDIENFHASHDTKVEEIKMAVNNFKMSHDINFEDIKETVKNFQMTQNVFGEEIKESVNDFQMFQKISAEDIKKNFQTSHKNYVKEAKDTFKNFQTSHDTAVHEIKETISDNQKSQAMSVKGIMMAVNRCPKAYGFFLSAGGNQCLKVFIDRKRTFSAADSHCKSEGLQLAKPQDVAGLQKYLVERYGDKDYWVGGRGTGSTYKWQRDDLVLSSSSEFWYPGEPDGGASSTSCMGMAGTANWLKAHPGQPYWSYACTGSWYSICEAIVQ